MSKNFIKKKEMKGKQNLLADGVPEPTNNIWKDDRLQHLISDPRFKSLPLYQRKVKIDKRFDGMFTNDKFKIKYAVDKYGRRINKSNADDLKKYYELDSSDEEKNKHAEKLESKENYFVGSSSEEEAEEREKEGKAIIKECSEINDVLSSGDEDVPKTLLERLVDPNIDYARGEGRLITDSSSDD